MQSSSFYRAKARKVLTGKWGEAVLATLCFNVCVCILYFPAVIPVQYMDSKPEFWLLSPVFLVLFIVLYPAVLVGYYFTFVKLHRGESEELTPDMLAIAKNNIKRPFVATLLLSLAVLGIVVVSIFIGALISSVIIGMTFPEGVSLEMIADTPTAMVDALPIVILSIYAVLFALLIPYNLAVAMYPYLLVDKQDMRPIDTLRNSRKMMKGHKLQLFCLALSFIGWALLAILTLGIGLLWLMPYQYTAIAAFYEDLRKENGLVVDGDEADNEQDAEVIAVEAEEVL